MRELESQITHLGLWVCEHRRHVVDGTAGDALLLKSI